jgi:hypothetical protein
MKERDLIILLALVALWFLLRRQALTPTVTTSETYQLPDVNRIPGTTMPADLAFWWTLMDLNTV